MESNETPYLFVSHKREDHSAALLIVERLEKRGFRCWIDARDIPLGTQWDEEIGERLFSATAVIWVKSPRSVIGDMVYDELTAARSNKQLIIPVEIEAVTHSGAAALRWQSLHRIQAFRFDNPEWDDRVIARLFELPIFASKKTSSAVLNAADSPLQDPHSVAVTPETPVEEHSPLAIILSDGRLYQLDALSGLGETLVNGGDSFATGGLGSVAVSPDASLIATSDGQGRIEFWVLGAADSNRGPILSAILPPEIGSPRMVTVDRPLGQAPRIIASADGTAFSIMQRLDGAWAAMKLLEGTDVIVAGASVRDDLLVVWASGTTSWASERSKRPFSLVKVRGVDAALGADGRYYLAAWGLAPDGSSAVEVVVESSNGWERVHRGPGVRLGIFRVQPDIVRQRPGATVTTIAVELEDGSVSVLPLPILEAVGELITSGD